MESHGPEDNRPHTCRARPGSQAFLAAACHTQRQAWVDWGCGGGGREWGLGLPSSPRPWPLCVPSHMPWPSHRLCVCTNILPWNMDICIQKNDGFDFPISGLLCVSVWFNKRFYLKKKKMFANLCPEFLRRDLQVTKLGPQDGRSCWPHSPGQMHTPSYLILPSPRVRGGTHMKISASPGGCSEEQGDLQDPRLPSGTSPPSLSYSPWPSLDPPPPKRRRSFPTLKPLRVLDHPTAGT